MKQLQKVLTVSALALMSLPSMAQDGEPILATQQKKSASKSANQRKLFQSINASIRSGVSSEPGEKINRTAGLMYIGTILPMENTSVTFLTGATAEITGIERETVLNNSLLIANLRNIYENQYGSFSLNGIAVLPTNEDTRDFTSLYTRVQFGPNWTVKLPIPNMFLRLRTNIARSFHEFSTATSGRSNNKYALNHRLDVGYVFNRYVNVAAVFSNTHRWNYNSRTPDVFGLSQTVNFNVIPGSTITLGHDIADQTFRNNGRASNVKLFDDRASTVYINFAQAF